MSAAASRHPPIGSTDEPSLKTLLTFTAALLIVSRSHAEPAPASGDVLPHIVAPTCTEPKRSLGSKIAGERGSVKLRYLVSAEGRVMDGEVTESSGHPRLDDVTLKALGLCEWVPGTHDGVPTEMWGPIKFTFR